MYQHTQTEMHIYLKVGSQNGIYTYERAPSIINEHKIGPGSSFVFVIDTINKINGRR